MVTSGRGGVLPPGLAVGMFNYRGDRRFRRSRSRRRSTGTGSNNVRLLEYGKVVPPEGPGDPAARGVSARRHPPAESGHQVDDRCAGAGERARRPGSRWWTARRQVSAMTHWLHGLDARLRALVPLTTALLAVLVDVLPLPPTGPAGATPLATLCVGRSSGACTGPTFSA